MYESLVSVDKVRGNLRDLFPDKLEMTFRFISNQPWQFKKTCRV